MLANTNAGSPSLNWSPQDGLVSSVVIPLLLCLVGLLNPSRLQLVQNKFIIPKFTPTCTALNNSPTQRRVHITPVKRAEGKKHHNSMIFLFHTIGMPLHKIVGLSLICIWRIMRKKNTTRKSGYTCR